MHDFHAVYFKIEFKNFRHNFALQTQSKLYHNITLHSQNSTQNSQILSSVINPK